MKRFPAPSSVTPLGDQSRAAVAGPPSPRKPPSPPPATVVMTPVAARRTRELSESAMKRFPAPSSATPTGPASCAAVAGPPSPPKPCSPVPATVVMMPVTVSTRRTRPLEASAMKRFPAPSSATPTGKSSRAAVAGPPSP